MKKKSLLRFMYSFIWFAIFIFFQSCVNFYKVTGSSKTSNVNSTVTANPQRYYILHNGDDAYSMDNVTVSNDQKSLSCNLENVAPEHGLRLDSTKKMRYKKNKPERAVLNEVHLYISKDSSAKMATSYTLNIDKVEKLELIEKDKVRTTVSYVLGGIGYSFVVVAGITVVGILIAVSLAP